MGTALNQTADVLAANADLKGIFGANEPTAIGTGRALTPAGKSGKVVAIGFDGNGDLKVPSFRDTGVSMVTKKNIDSAAAKNVLY